MISLVIVHAVVLMVSCSTASAQSIVINEVMSSNASTIADEDGDYEDWVELYNPGNDTVGLLGYGLSDDYGNPFRWVFPDVSLAPGEFLLVWASGKNRTQADQALHTNFSISQAGEEVVLTQPDGTRADELAPLFLPTDISYGRQPDGGNQWFYFDEPTPGYHNTSQAYHDILDPPGFSHESGFYSTDFHLSLWHDDPDVTIIYSMDGSAPNLQNLDGKHYSYKNQYPQYPGDPFGDLLTKSYFTNLYDKPIDIRDRLQDADKITGISSTWHNEPYYFPDEPVFKANVIRAKAYKEGSISSKDAVGVFFINEMAHERYSLPVISFSTDEMHLFDYEEGIYVAGVDFDNWRINNPDTHYSYSWYNAMRRGYEWEYPAHIALFGNDGNLLLNQHIGFRIHGGWTRSFPAKTLRLYARNEYGFAYMHHPFFPKQPYSSFKRILLRNSGQDWEFTLFRDAAIQEIMSGMRLDIQAYQPSILFINGEYWGIHNIRERFDKHYLARVYGADEESLDILDLNSVVVEGDNEHYLQMIDYFENNDISQEVHYNHIARLMDVENFIDYQIAQIFASNVDWPDRNLKYWRVRTSNYMPDADYGLDGRWRWFFYDTDAGFGAWTTSDFDALTHATKPLFDWANLIMRNLLLNNDFVDEFLIRFADLLNTAFLPCHTKDIILTMKQTLDPEIEEHIARWSTPSSKEKWEEYVDVMLEFARERPGFQKQHIKDYFGLDGMINVTLDVNNQLMGHIRINTIDINTGTPGVDTYPYPWKGEYFKGVQIEAEAIAAPGYRFSHWGNDHHDTNPVVTSNAQEDLDLMAHFERIDEPVLIHYWYFGTSIPNDTPLSELSAFYTLHESAHIEYKSALEGYPYYAGHPLWRKASMERRNSPTSLNYRPDGNSDQPYVPSAMRGLQVRQPFEVDGRQNTMVLHAPVDGFSDVVFKFAAKDEGAAENLVVDYQINPDSDEWTTSGLEQSIMPLLSSYRMYEVDFGHVDGVSNNRHFKVRVRFDGPNMQADQGNRVTFNNISLEGRARNAHNVWASAEENGTIYPSGRIPVYDEQSLELHIKPNENHQIDRLYVDGVDVSGSLQADEDGAAAFVLENIKSSHHVHASFSLSEDQFNDNDDGVIIYPNPAGQSVYIESLAPIKSISIANLSGQVLLKYDSLNTHRHVINSGVLRNGLYIVIIRTEGKNVSKKLQIIR